MRAVTKTENNIPRDTDCAFITIHIRLDNLNCFSMNVIVNCLLEPVAHLSGLPNSILRNNQMENQTRDNDTLIPFTSVYRFDIKFIFLIFLFYFYIFIYAFCRGAIIKKKTLLVPCSRRGLLAYVYSGVFV